MPDLGQSADSLPPVKSSVGRLTIRGLEVRALPDASLLARVEALECALEGLVLELVENGSLPPEVPNAKS